MDLSDYLTALERDGRAFLASCSAAPADAVIDACPEWHTADLLWHLTEVHAFWRSVVEQRATHWDQVIEPVRPDDGAVLTEMFRRGLGALLTTLATVDPTTEIWTWSAQQDAAFVIRRMAQETAMHRWDADRAAGQAVAIEATLASDGIDEFLTHFVHNRDEDARLDGSVHLHCTDVPGEWTTRTNEDGHLVTVAEHVKGDCALRGPADVLLRALWRRATIADLDVVGDAAVAAQFLAYARLE